MLFDPEKIEIAGTDYLPENDDNFKGKTLVDQNSEEILYEIPFERFSYVHYGFDTDSDFYNDEYSRFCVLSDEINNEDRSLAWSGKVDFTIDKYSADDGYILHIYKHYTDEFKTLFKNVSGEDGHDYDIWLIHDEEIMNIARNDSDAEAVVRYSELDWMPAEEVVYIEDMHDLRSEINQELKFIIVSGEDFDDFKSIWGSISNVVIGDEEEGKHPVNSYDYTPRDLMNKYTLISKCQCCPHFRVTRSSLESDIFDTGNFPVDVINYYQYTTIDTYAGKKYIQLTDESWFGETEVAHDLYRNWAWLTFNTGFVSVLQPSSGYSSRILRILPYSLNVIEKLNEKVDNVINSVEETFEHFQEEIDDIMVDVTNTISNLYVSR